MPINFSDSDYENFLSEDSQTQNRLFSEYQGSNNDFDIIIIGSGMGGGVLADDLADNLGSSQRILLLEAGSYLFPTHVYNICRFPNADVARKFAVKTFTQDGGESDQYYIHEQPQLNFGGRSIFWSGLIPTIQSWELEFFPQRVRQDLADFYLQEAGQKMNVSLTMGNTAQAIVAALRNSPLNEHFDIQETPRAIHQPYLTEQGSPREQFYVESTGVFNTAELLVNQLGLTNNSSGSSSQGLNLLLNRYVQHVDRRDGQYVVNVKNTLNGSEQDFTARFVIFAAGSIESPKILHRSPLFNSLSNEIKPLVGRGITDHPTTDSVAGLVTHIGDIPIPKSSHGKIIFYSRGKRDADGSIFYPFNVEMNINHEYWHLRENDPTSVTDPFSNTGDSIIDIKFSFGNCIDDENIIELGNSSSPNLVPKISFKNLHWLDDLADNRFKALAGWNKNFDDIFAVLNGITYQIFSQFTRHGAEARPEGWYGQDNRDFGYGTVHHAVGTLRMPTKSSYDAASFNENSVVNEDLMVIGQDNLFVCDMSVMPISSAANPVRTLTGLSLRLSNHLQGLMS